MSKKQSIKSSPSKTGILNLSDLIVIKNTQSEQFYFGLNESYKRELFETALSITGTIRELSKEIRINYFNLWDCIKRAPISLSNLQKISSFLVKKGYVKFSLKEIEKNLEYIKGGFTNEKVCNPKFPINFLTKEGMRLISHIYHDGGIGENNRQPHYKNYSLTECEEFLSDANFLFGEINRKVMKDKEDIHYVRLPTIIGDLLILAGYSPGDKTKNNPKTFEFLKNITDKELIGQFLAKAFNDDGCVGKRGLYLEQSSLIKEGIKNPSNVLLVDKFFLEKLGLTVSGPKLYKIYPNRYGHCTKYGIAVYRKEQLKRFNDYVKLIDHKKEKLEKYLNSGYKLN